MMSKVTSSRLFVAPLLVALLIVATPTYTIRASQPVYGNMQIHFKSPPNMDGTWQLEITAAPFSSFHSGEIRLYLLPMDSPSSLPSPRIVWSGDGALGDTIRVACSLDPPPSGGYGLVVQLVPHPDQPHASGRFGHEVYVEVSDSEVLYSEDGPAGVEYQKIIRELRSRGFSDTTIEGLKRDAPDLARRYARMTTRTVAPDTTRVASRSSHRIPPDSSQHPEWGPPRAAYPKDSALLDTGSGGLPKRVLDYRRGDTARTIPQDLQQWRQGPESKVPAAMDSSSGVDP